MVLESSPKVSAGAKAVQTGSGAIGRTTPDPAEGPVPEALVLDSSRDDFFRVTGSKGGNASFGLVVVQASASEFRQMPIRQMPSC